MVILSRRVKSNQFDTASLTGGSDPASSRDLATIILGGGEPKGIGGEEGELIRSAPKTNVSKGDT